MPACRIFVPQPWIQLCSLQWKHIVLTSDPPGKFLSLHLNTSSKETFIHCCGLEDEQLSPGKKLLTQKTFSAMSEIWELALVQPWNDINSFLSLVTWGAQRSGLPEIFSEFPWSQNYFHSYTKMAFALHSHFLMSMQWSFLETKWCVVFQQSECRSRWHNPVVID